MRQVEFDIIKKHGTNEIGRRDSRDKMPISARELRECIRGGGGGGGEGGGGISCKTREGYNEKGYPEDNLSLQDW